MVVGYRKFSVVEVVCVTSQEMAMEHSLVDAPLSMF